jgi:hypothetical protein
MELKHTVNISREMRDVLNNNTVFTKSELIILFGDNEIVTWMKLNGYLYQSSDCRWRKTEKLNELLADGAETIN